MNPVMESAMERTPVCRLGQRLGELVRVDGWVQGIRTQKRMCFLILRDRTGLAQVTVDRERRAELDAILAALTPESTVGVVGTVQRNEAVRLNGWEIIPDSILVHAAAEPQLPLQEGARIDTRLDWRFLDLRLPRSRLVLEVQSTVEAAMRSFWSREGFLEIHSPKLMGSPSEGGAELFEVGYFGGTAYLAQSPQFYKQMAMAAGLEKVFEIGPAFRADPSFTTRHATEFTSVDMELSWVESHEDVMRLEERWLQHVLRAVAEAHGEAIGRELGTTVVVPELPFPRMSMEEVKEVLERSGHVPPPDSRPGDLDPGAEARIGEHVRERTGHEFLFVTDYDRTVRPFYHMRHPERPGKTRSFDLLWKGVEITTGAQREHRHERLLAQAAEKGVSRESIGFYLDFFRYGCPPHGGLGLGLARLMMLLLGLPSIREASFVFRGPTRLTP